MEPVPKCLPLLNYLFGTVSSEVLFFPSFWYANWQRFV